MKNINHDEETFTNPVTLKEKAILGSNFNTKKLPHSLFKNLFVGNSTLDVPVFGLSIITTM